MAHADTQTVGIEHGSTNTCQDCNGQLRCVDGDSLSDNGTFREEYRCIKCGKTGQFVFRPSGERYSGICADYDYYDL